jgi:large repetitive protein
MVAAFTGTGLGLFNSSVTQLGGASGGAGRLGQSNSRYSVNVASGNLVLQDIDETILTRGLPVSMLRTYNSQGTVAGQGQDGWMSAFDRRVGTLTGTANTAGSTLTRYLADGSQALFVYDTGRARYVSAVGDGIHDEILWNASAGTAQWMDMNAKVREQYDASGRLIMVGSLETGVSYNLSYDAAGRLFSIVSNVSASGDGLFLAYDSVSGRLIAVVSRENGQAYGQVWYD